MLNKLSKIILLVSILGSGCQAMPTIAASKTPAPLATENIPFPIDSASPQAPSAEPSPVMAELDPSSVAIQGGALGEAHIALVPEQPFDNTGGPLVRGLPAHIQILFGNQASPLYYGEQSVLTIIPIEPYIQMWSDNGNPIVNTLFTAIQELIKNPPVEAPHSQLPVLPLDAVQAVIDIAAQFRPLDTNLMQGYRFVGRLSQGINPVINANLYYFYMGVSRDGEYIINMMVPVKSSALVDRIEDLPAVDNDLVYSDYMQYMQSIRQRLNQQTGSDFQPSLDDLDAVVKSLEWGW
ncbi:MAG: hypothetical protein BGO78_08985 [Chloroflexi bacterium 44-23]|nr:MAG: hypothetical protein BGO78_08985 [Chloroflexi bacterium 44-23]